MRNRILSIWASTLALLLSASAAEAKIRLPEILSDHMVLQQNSQVHLWGEAAANSKVTVRTSWSKVKYMTFADKDGRWMLSIDTPAGGYDARTVTVSDRESTVTLSDILIGEVWLCGGQSNMEMPLEGFYACPIEGAAQEIATSGSYRDRIRRVKVPKTGSEEVQEYVKGSWEQASPATTSLWTAVGWFYAKALNATLDVPVGILECCWGGSAVESWLPKEIVYTYPESTVPTGHYMPPRREDGSYSWNTSIIMYNAMLHPVSRYTLKGFLWYQGETNAGLYQYYADRLTTMASVWRELWGQGDLPFYIVELAQYSYWYHGDGTTAGARLREAQHKAAEMIPNSGIITINDLALSHEYDQIHPQKKREVGERLAYMALNRTYGYKEIPCDPPVYKEIRIDGDKVNVYFDNAKMGLSPWHDISGFEIAGEDRVFYPAKAELSRWDLSIITLTCEQVSKPAAVRYCFRDFIHGNLTGNNGVPVPQFRSDGWE